MRKIKMKYLVIIGVVISVFILVVSIESLVYHMRVGQQSSSLEFDFRTASMFASMGALDELHYWYKVIGDDSESYANEDRIYILFGVTAEHRNNYVNALDNYYKASLHGRNLQNDYDSDSKQAIEYLKIGNSYTDKATALTDTSYNQIVIMFIVSLISTIGFLLWYVSSDNLDLSIQKYFKIKRKKVVMW